MESLLPLRFYISREIPTDPRENIVIPVTRVTALIRLWWKMSRIETTVFAYSNIRIYRNILQPHIRGLTVIMQRILHAEGLVSCMRRAINCARYNYTIPRYCPADPPMMRYTLYTKCCYTLCNLSKRQAIRVLYLRFSLTWTACIFVRAPIWIFSTV